MQRSRFVCLQLSAAGAVLLASSLRAQVTQRVSVDSTGAQGNAESGSRGLAITPDGRFIAFTSAASNLVPGDTNGFYDVFVRDRWAGTTERVSVDSTGNQGNDNSAYPAISSDGRFVAFASVATNLVAGDTNGAYDVFVRDRQAGTTERISVDSGGNQGNGSSGFDGLSTFGLAISADGRFVEFQSLATNLVTGDTNAVEDIFLRDRQLGTTERISVDSSGTQSNGSSDRGSISADGRYVSFESVATNLVPGDTNASMDVFVRDRQLGTTERVSVDSGGVQGNADSAERSLSADGRYVAFTSSASNLVAGDTNGFSDVFVRDRQAGTTELVSVSTGGAQGNADSQHPSISADGHFVAFRSSATNLVIGDTNAATDIFVRDRQAATTERVSVDSSGVQGNGDSAHPSIDSDGRFVAFHSLATNLVSGDTNSVTDVFLHDRNETGFASLCEPSVGTVRACPCSNPPSGPDRGCNNSAGTGGATLTESGLAYLSMDSVVFTTSGERPTAFGILLQGTLLLPNGLIYGQGIRCVGGTLKRLYAKNASGGSMIAPNFGAGDPAVSVRSAALGDVIQPGQSRWYLVYYRDPMVLGGCPATSTFNATQTGRVDWSL